MRKPIIDGAKRFIALWRKACEGSLSHEWASRLDRASLAAIVVGIRDRFRLDIKSFFRNPSEMTLLERDAEAHRTKMEKMHKEVEQARRDRERKDD